MSNIFRIQIFAGFSVILSNTQLERKLLTIEKKITRYNHHKEFLQNYKVNRKYLKV